jgi:8-oxo-dGTP diphosphatase
LSKGHAVAVLLVTPQGIPLVRDPKKPAPVFWKLPGGRGDETETAQGCAIRELEEELGVSLSENDLAVVHSEDKGSHVLTIFRADLTALPQMKSEGDEREEIGVFKPRDILAKQDFFPNHRKVVGELLAALS